MEFDHYSGPSIFPDNPERKGWVPIFPMEVKDDQGTTRENETRSNRKLVLLRLAWAWTIWKVQGQTYNRPVVIHLVKDEKSQGLSYTAFSRATRLGLSGVAGGMAGNRLTSKITDRSELQHRKREDKRLRRLQTDMEEVQA